MKIQSFLPGRYTAILLGILVLFGLYLTSLYSYLLFHSLVELFSIVVACSIFVVAWNSRRFLDNNYLLFIGIAYLFIGGLDLIHTLAYSGMGVFQGYDTNLPTQLWIAARYVESLSLFVAFLFLRRKLKGKFVFVGYTLLTSLLLASIFIWNIFPQSFVEGVGLTPFKKISEYIISLILLGSIILLLKNRRELDKGVLKLLAASIVLTIGSELFFTFYVSAYGLSNLIGHFFKIISFYLIYKALIETGLTKPYNLLFRNLKQSEEELRKHREQLVELVEERTTELITANEQLQQEITERKRAEKELRQVNRALETLSECNQVLVRAKEESDLLHKICQTIVEIGGYRLAWVGFAEQDEGKTVRPVAQAGYEEGYLDTVNITWADTEQGRGATGTAIQTGKPYVVKNVLSNPGYAPWRAEATKRGYASVIALPLVADGRTFGALNIYAAEINAFDADEVKLLVELADDLAYGIVTLRTRAERKQAEYDIRERVKELTCLYGVSQLVAKTDTSLDDILKGTVELIPPGWQYPEITCARITFNDKEFKTGNFALTKWKQASDIEVGGKKVGILEVYYLEEKPESDKGPFLKEERNLINGITRLLGEKVERKHSEEALRDSEEKLRLMFESVADSITVSDLNGAIANANERAVEMLRLGSKEELLGKTLFEFIPQRYHSEVRTIMQQGLIEGAISVMENILIRPDGTEFPGEISVSILKNATGDPTGFITVIRDITEQRKMEEQLIITDRLASIGELAAGIAHELNNPLTGVIGLSQLLAERDLPEDVKEDLKLVYSEAQRAAGVVKNMLAFAREHPPAKELLSINDVISKVLELRAYEQRLSNIEVVKHLASDLPQIMGDYFQLQQVFLNIVINAEQIMTEVHGKGTLMITTQTMGDIVTASFADDGPGILKENLGHIFDPFFTTKEVGKGTGLGLSICHGIISTHGGRIYAESEPGKGATFIVELPLSQEEQ